VPTNNLAAQRLPSVCERNFRNAFYASELLRYLTSESLKTSGSERPVSSLEREAAVAIRVPLSPLVHTAP